MTTTPVAAAPLPLEGATLAGRRSRTRGVHSVGGAMPAPVRFVAMRGVA